MLFKCAVHYIPLLLRNSPGLEELLELNIILNSEDKREEKSWNKSPQKEKQFQFVGELKLSFTISPA